MFDLFEIMQEFFNILVEWGGVLFNFLFSEVTVLKWTFRPFYALPAVGIAFILVKLAIS